jgi:hypothetical protein
MMLTFYTILNGALQYPSLISAIRVHEIQELSVHEIQEFRDKRINDKCKTTTNSSITPDKQCIVSDSGQATANYIQYLTVVMPGRMTGVTTVRLDTLHPCSTVLNTLSKYVDLQPNENCKSLGSRCHAVV